MLALQNVSFDYDQQPIVQAIDLILEAGQVLGIAGPNGAGKSTIIKLMTGLLKAKSGRISLKDQDLKDWPRLAYARHVAVVTQNATLPPGFRIEEIVMMGRTPHLGFLAAETATDREHVADAMKRCDVWSFRNKTVDQLSGGERQRVILARALAQDPSVLLLDEPSNHLDLKYQTELLHLIRQEAKAGMAVLVVLHDLNLAARSCDQLLLLAKGRVQASGTPSEVLTAELLEKIYQTRLHVFSEPQTGWPTVLPRG